MKNYILILTLFYSSGLVAQQKSEFDKMSFLIGNWEFDAKSLADDGTYQPQKFLSKVEYIFGGNALRDDFCFKNQQGDWVIYGSTIRSYDVQAGKWKMLWYNYNLSFVTQMVGSYADGEFHFTGEGIDEKGKYQERITFYDISKDKYSWKSDKSYDGGKTWLKNFFSYTATRLMN